MGLGVACAKWRPMNPAPPVMRARLTSAPSRISPIKTSTATLPRWRPPVRVTRGLGASRAGR